MGIVMMPSMMKSPMGIQSVTTHNQRSTDTSPDISNQRSHARRSSHCMLPVIVPKSVKHVRSRRRAMTHRLQEAAEHGTQRAGGLA